MSYLEVKMGYCSYSSQLIIENKTAVDNLFINEFLPYAPSDCVKVYLYGLYVCGDSNSTHNTIEQFSRALNMSMEDIESSFLFWQDQGLVKILETIPKEIVYLPVKNALAKPLKLKEDKYLTFNTQIQEIIKGRMISPNEYFEYYATMESLHIEQEAMLMIAKYCVDFKGQNVNYPYILAVAKSWANDGYKTAKSINDKLMEYQNQDENMSILMQNLKINHTPTIEERDLFDKWQAMGFDLSCINFVAKMMKKAKKNNVFDILDNKFLKYYEMHLFSTSEIDAYEIDKTNMLNLAKDVCKNIGVYYENLEPVVENYIANWKNMGYDDETIICISNYCFKSSIRTLEYMDVQLKKFFKLGITSVSALNEYMNEVLDNEEKIKEILKKLSLSRNVNSFDRECFKIWTQNWNMSDELISYACELAHGKGQPIQYVNRILSLWHEATITTIEQAKEFKAPTKETKSKFNYSNRKYTKEELNSLFTNLDEIDL